MPDEWVNQVVAAFSQMANLSLKTVVQQVPTHTAPTAYPAHPSLSAATQSLPLFSSSPSLPGLPDAQTTLDLLLTLRKVLRNQSACFQSVHQGDAFYQAVHCIGQVCVIAPTG